MSGRLPDESLPAWLERIIGIGATDAQINGVRDLLYLEQGQHMKQIARKEAEKVADERLHNRRRTGSTPSGSVDLMVTQSFVPGSVVGSINSGMDIPESTHSSTAMAVNEESVAEDTTGK